MKQIILGAAVALALGVAASGRVAAQTAEEPATEPDGTPAAESTTTETTEAATDAAEAADSTATTDPFADPATSSSTTEAADAAADADVDAQPPATTTPPADAPPADADPGAAPAETPGAPATDADAPTQPPAPGQPSADADAAVQGDADVRAGANVTNQRNLTAGLQFGQATERGLILDSVARDSFFFRHGLRPGDVIVSYGGRPMRSQAEFSRWVGLSAGATVPMVVLRDGRPETINVVYERRTGERFAQQGPATGAFLGVTFDGRYPRHAVVSRVAPGSPAEQAGVSPGDVIVGINGEQVANAQHVIQIVGGLQPNTEIDLAISRRVVLGMRHSVARPATAPRAATAPAAIQPLEPAAPAGSLQPGVYQEATPIRPAQDIDEELDDADRDGRILDGDADRDGRLLDNDRVLPRD